MSWSGESEPPAGPAEAQALQPPTAPEYGGAIERRDNWIGLGASLVAGCTVLNVVATVLVIVFDVRNHALTGISVSDGFAFLSPLGTVLGAAFASSAFLRPSGARSARLRRGAFAVAIGFAGLSVAAAILGGIFAAHHIRGTLTVSIIAGAAGGALAAVAFLAAGSAFGGAGDRSMAGFDDSWRDSRLASAALTYAAAMICSIVSDALALSAVSGLAISSTTKTAADLELVSVIVEFLAAALVAGAFLRAVSGRGQVVPDWFGRRERQLAAAAVALLLALTLYAIATTIAAGQTSSAAPGLYKTAKWLGTAGNITVLGGFLCVLVGMLATASAARGRRQASTD